jgi:epoxyqueuosine reductase
MKRAKLRGLKRNAAVALGNIGTTEDSDVLVRALHHHEALVRSHAAWALGRLAGPASAAALRDRLEAEPDEGVRADLRSALDAVSRSGR